MDRLFKVPIYNKLPGQVNFLLTTLILTLLSDPDNNIAATCF